MGMSLVSHLSLVEPKTRNEQKQTYVEPSDGHLGTRGIQSCYALERVATGLRRFMVACICVWI